MMRFDLTGVIILALLAPQGLFAQAPKTMRNSLGMRLVRVAPGQYQRGARDSRLIEAMHPNTVY